MYCSPRLRLHTQRSSSPKWKIRLGSGRSQMCGALYDVRRISRQMCRIALKKYIIWTFLSSGPQHVPSMRVIASGPCPFSNITICPTMSNQDYYYFGDSLPPIYGILYPLSSVQDAGWFEHPMYFVDEGSDGKRQVLCWSVSTYTEGVIHYVWHVYWSSHFDLAFGLCQLIRHHGSTSFKAGNYLFATLTPDRRAVWRIVNPPNDLVSPHVPVNLHSKPQMHWFGSNSVPTTNLVAQLHAPPPPYSAYQPADNLPQDVPDHCINLEDMYFSSVSTPHAQNSDASSDASSPETPETEDVTWDSGRYFSIDESGVVTLIVPGHLRDQQAVKDFIVEALNSGQLGKSVRKVKCSRCKNKKAKKFWDIKPSNLERHILAHLGIKCFYCPVYGCVSEFTTKDQRKKHVENKHPILAERLKANGAAGRKRRMTSVNIVPGMQAASSPVTTGLPIGGAEPLVTNQVNQPPQAQYVVPFGTTYDFNFSIN
ncbi:hypothetical protein B0J17DRAFT_218539 [Rhizoctonia solani]|nr:hypothetical protein B0J17DRAFT_218539 [Rhizoctonia solani]